MKTQKKAKQTDLERSDDLELLANPITRELLDELVPPNSRPKHRTGFWGLWGKTVDTLDWCKDEIARLNKDIDEQREKSEGRFLGSAFVRCNLQMGAHILSQCLSYHEVTTL